jgi:hypothetical protein
MGNQSDSVSGNIKRILREKDVYQQGDFLRPEKLREVFEDHTLDIGMFKEALK